MAAKARGTPAETRTETSVWRQLHLDAGAGIVTLVLPEKWPDQSPLAGERQPLGSISRQHDIRSEKGIVLGTYQRRGDATKAVSGMAYEPELRW